MDERGAAEHHEVIIMGAGFSGLAMALALQRDGHEDHVLLERAGDLGGTWRDNTYPGCACDVPSVVYSLAHAPNPGWTQAFAGQAEIWAYMQDVARRHGIRDRVRPGCEVLGADWDEDAGLWRLATTGGAYTADVLISAVGALADPAIPAVDGLETFGGHVFHSARWDHDHDLRGRRVAVVGTGASAVQFVPEIQPQVAHLTVFQRTPPWVIPRPEIGIGATWRARFARHPRLLRALRSAVFSLLELRHRTFRSSGPLVALNERSARRHLERQVADPELRRRLTPSYRMGCKRILLSSTWYPAITAANATIVPAGVERLVPEGIVDAQGTTHAVDTIIFATGFHVTDQPIAGRVRGRDGRTLAERWGDSPQAYLGTAVAGLPNFFMLLGPNTGLGHNSVLLMVESQLRYVRAALAFRARHAGRTVEPRPGAQAAWVAEVDAAMAGSVWTAGGCQSWYLDATGRNATLWPGTVRGFRRRVGRFVAGDHHVGPVPAGRRPEPVPA